MERLPKRSPWGFPQKVVPLLFPQGEATPMKKHLLVVLAVFCVYALTATAAENEKSHLRARLVGIEEANGPSTVITDGTGTFTATINDDATITYTLTYKNLSTPIQQAHIHIGATKLNGGVSIFLCANVAAPAGTPAPPPHATHSGTPTPPGVAADVIGPADPRVPTRSLAQGVFATAGH